MFFSLIGRQGGVDDGSSAAPGSDAEVGNDYYSRRQDDDKESQLSLRNQGSVNDSSYAALGSDAEASRQDDDEESQLDYGRRSYSDVDDCGGGDDEGTQLSHLSNVSSPSDPTHEDTTEAPATSICIPGFVASVLFSISVPEILCYGLMYAGFDLQRQQRNNERRRIEWFKSFYGVEPTTVSPFFNDLRNAFPSINFKIALMTMQWLFLYPTYPVLSGQVSDWRRADPIYYA